MTRHKFAVGQTVDFSRGRYTIRRLMPSETRDLSYRVQSVTDGHERVVLESQLRDVGPQIFKAAEAKPD